MAHLETLRNFILAGASGCALYRIPPHVKPYAYMACVFGCCHGVLGLTDNLIADNTEEYKQIKQLSARIMEIVPLPLVNIELYLASSSSVVALGHGAFMIPLAFDLFTKLFAKDKGKDSQTETLKDLTILGNVTSLTYLAVNESNYLYAGIALYAFWTRFGAMLSQTLYEVTGEFVDKIYLTTQAIKGKKA